MSSTKRIRKMLRCLPESAQQGFVDHLHPLFRDQLRFGELAPLGR